MVGEAGENSNNSWDLQMKKRRSEKHQDEQGERVEQIQSDGGQNSGHQPNRRFNKTKHNTTSESSSDIKVNLLYDQTGFKRDQNQ